MICIGLNQIPAVRMDKNGQTRWRQIPVSQTGQNCLFLTTFEKIMGF